MDSTFMMILVIGIILLVAWYFFGRNRVAPAGTYDDENYRSRGSIGGSQTGAYDDPNFRSRGSFGGRSRSYDAPNYQNRGAAGGSSTRSSSTPSANRGQEAQSSKRSQRATIILSKR